MKKSFLLFQTLCILGALFTGPGAVLALSPFYEFQDLVAGGATKGFSDGPFYTAQFDQPQGLALSNDHQSLYVADTQNNRIRLIDLAHQNQVSTLVGSDKQGSLDGLFSVALFNHPICPVVLPDNRVIVYDMETRALRAIDLEKKTVTTLKIQTKANDPGILEVWNMAYWPAHHSLCFTDPDSGTIKELNLETLTLKTILQSNTDLVSPFALCALNDDLYVSDRKTGAIFEIAPGDPKAPVKAPATTPAGTPTVIAEPSLPIKKICATSSAVALAGSGKNLYAYQADMHSPILRVLPDAAPLTFVSTSGYHLLRNTLGPILFFFSTEPGVRVGFLPAIDPSDRFYINNGSCVCAFRDLNFGQLCTENGEDAANSNGIHEFEYSEKKPPKTFRILLVGRSYLYNSINDIMFEAEDKNLHEVQNYLWDTAKQLEFSLNTKAALNDWPTHFEVLNASMHVGTNGLEIWPYYMVPPLVKKYDIDLVLMLKDDNIMFPYTYFCCPLTSEGIPALHADPEFMLKPNSEKFKSGPMHDLFQIIANNPKRYSAFNPEKASNADFCFNLGFWTADPKVNEALLTLIVKPLTLTREKIDSIITSSGKPCRFETWLFPAAVFGSEAERVFYREAYRRAGIPYKDLCDDLRVLNFSLGPLRSDPINGGHFTRHGAEVFSQIVEQELIKNGEIPTGPATTTAK